MWSHSFKTLSEKEGSVPSPAAALPTILSNVRPPVLSKRWSYEGMMRIDERLQDKNYATSNAKIERGRLYSCTPVIKKCCCEGGGKSKVVQSLRQASGKAC